MRAKKFSQFLYLKDLFFSKSNLFYFLFIATFISWIPNPTYGSAFVHSFRQDVMERIFKRSLQEINRLISYKPPPTCFISRVCMPDEHPDTVWSDRIESYLTQAGVKTVYDKKDLGGGVDIREFVKRVNTTDFVMPLFSPCYLENYEKRTWIFDEAQLTKQRLEREGRRFYVPVLLVGRDKDSIPRDSPADPTVYLYYPMTKGPEYHTDADACYECIFRVLREQLFQEDFKEGAPYFERFNEIERKFGVKKRNFPYTVSATVSLSSNGSFPQSLRDYKAFIERTDESGLSYLDRIFDELFMSEDEKIRSSTATLCASGLGGVGKTTLAVEYAHKFGSFYDFVYWINGESRSALLRSCVALLKILGISIPETDIEARSSDIIRLANEALPQRYPRSLLVVDNIENPSIADLVPSGGHVLYTSRNSDWLRKIEIDVLKRDESVRLLLQLTGLDSSFADQASILAEELGDLPLALSQAAAYIRQRKLSSFAKYLEHYKTNQARLLAQKQIQHPLNQRDVVVMTTWDTTMGNLSQASRDLMGYFSYLDPDNIPLKVFGNIEGLDDTVSELAEYSMIKRDADSESISIHRLVQMVERLKQEREGVAPSLTALLENWTKFFVRGFEERESEFSHEYRRLRIFSRERRGTNIQSLTEMYNSSHFLMNNAEKIKQYLDLKRSRIAVDQGTNLAIWLRCLEKRARYFVSILSNQFILSQYESSAYSSALPDWVYHDYMPNKLRLTPDQYREFIRTIGHYIPAIREEVTDIFDVLSAVAKISLPEMRKSILSFAQEVLSNNLAGFSWVGLVKPLSKVRQHEWSSLVSQAKSFRLNKSDDTLQALVDIPFSDRTDVLVKTKEILRGISVIGDNDCAYIIKAVASLVDGEREKLVIKVKGLTIPSMKGSDVAIITQAVANVTSDEWESVESQAASLFTSSMSDADRARLNEAVSAIKSHDRIRVISQSMSFITERMNALERIEILRGLSRADPKEWWDRLALRSQELVDEDTSASDRIRILERLAVLDQTEMDSVVVCCRKFKKKKIDTFYFPRLIDIFSAILQNREKIANLVELVFVPTMSVYDFPPLIAAIQMIKEGEEEKVIANSMALFSPDFNGEDKAIVIKAINSIEVGKRDKVARLTRTLLSSKETSLDLINLIQAIQDIKDGEEESVLAAANLLFKDRMNISEDKARVIKAINSIEVGKRDKVARLTRTLASSKETTSGLIDLIQAIQDIKDGEEESVLAAANLIFRDKMIFRDRMNTVNKVAIIRAINALEIGEREAIAPLIALLKIPTATAIEMDNLIRAMKNLKGEISERMYVVEQTKALTDGITKVKEHIQMLERIGSLIAEERDRVIRFGLEFIKKSMTFEERLGIIKRIKEISREVWEEIRPRLIREEAWAAKIEQRALLNLLQTFTALEKANREHLFDQLRMFSEMGLDESSLIKTINVLAMFSPEERSHVLDLTGELAGKKTNKTQYGNLVIVISNLNSKSRVPIIELSKRLMIADMKIETQAEMIKAVESIPSSEEREEVVCQIESLLPLQELRGGHCALLVRNLGLISRTERMLAVDYARRFITDEMNKSERGVVALEVFRLYQLVKERDLERLNRIISPDMTGAGRVEIFKRVQKLKPKTREQIFDQIFSQLKDEMSGSDRVRLVISIASAVSRASEMASSGTGGSKTVAVVVPMPAVKVVVEKRDPIEEILSSLEETERPVILGYAKEIAPDSIGTPSFGSLVEVFSGMEREDREAVTQHAKTFANGRMSLSDRIEIIKTILALEKSDRERILAQARVLVSERMSASERIQLIRMIEAMTPEDRELAVPQAQRLFGQTVSASDMSAVLVVSTDRRDEVIADTEEFISTFGYASSLERVELLKAIVGLKSNKAHVLACVRAMNTGIRTVSEVTSIINSLSGIESDAKRAEVTDKIRMLRAPITSFSPLLERFSNTDLINILFESEGIYL